MGMNCIISLRTKIANVCFVQHREEQMGSGLNLFVFTHWPLFHALEPGLDLAPLTNIRKRTGTQAQVPEDISLRRPGSSRLLPRNPVPPHKSELLGSHL